MKKPALIISACLAGKPCRYDGAARPLENLGELKKFYRLIPVCPETDGGLPVPRPPAEIRGGRVLTADGRDVTAFYEKGARIAVSKAVKAKAARALLKEKSPSCGSSFVYDGTFHGVAVSGEGVAARALRQSGVVCFSENETDSLFAQGATVCRIKTEQDPPGK